MTQPARAYEGTGLAELASRAARYPYVVPLEVREIIKPRGSISRGMRTTGDHRIYRSPDGRVTVVFGKLGDDVRLGMARDPEANWNRGAGQMKLSYSLAIEGEPGSYSAYVPELPAILVTGRSLDELMARARQAIQLYLESIRADISPGSMLREIEVELPA